MKLAAREARKTTTKIKHKKKADKKTNRSSKELPEWQARVLSRIRDPDQQPMCRAEVERIVISKGGISEKARNPEEAARKCVERFMKRNKLCSRRGWYKTKKSAFRLWKGIQSNFRQYDCAITEIKEYHQKTHQPFYPTAPVHIVCLNTDETFLRDNYSGRTIIPKDVLPSARWTVNQADSYSGQSLVAHLSSTPLFHVPPTIICAKNSPSRINKKRIQDALREGYGSGRVVMGGNKMGKHWMDEALWAQIINDVIISWKSYAKTARENGSFVYLVWYKVLIWFCWCSEYIISHFRNRA